jgi:hypothetical protein
MSPRFWLGLQKDYDLDVAEDEMGDRLSQDVVAIASHLHGIVFVESIDPGGQTTVCPYRPPVGANGCLPSSSSWRKNPHRLVPPMRPRSLSLLLTRVH